MTENDGALMNESASQDQDAVAVAKTTPTTPEEFH